MLERDHFIPLWILAITSHRNLPMSKVTSVLLRGVSNPNIIVRLGEDADRLDTPQADIISHLLNRGTSLLCLRRINPNAMAVQSEKDYIV